MFTVYSKPNCKFCTQAKALLESKSLPFTELIIDVGQVKEPNQSYVTVEQLKQRVPSARTVPVIFHGDTLVGGYEALVQHLK